MKNSFFIALMTTMVAFADKPAEILDTSSDLQTMPDLPRKQKTDKNGFFYVRFAAAENDLTQVSSVLPGLGIGYRLLAGNGAADISISGIGTAEHKNHKYFWTFPKTAYIHYLNPSRKKSAYVGGGIAWGGIRSKTEDLRFTGIIPNLTAGIEFAHKSSFLSFSELTISQPLISIYTTRSLPGPCIEFSAGIGF